MHIHFISNPVKNPFVSFKNKGNWYNLIYILRSNYYFTTLHSTFNSKKRNFYKAEKKQRRRMKERKGQTDKRGGEESKKKKKIISIVSRVIGGYRQSENFLKLEKRLKGGKEGITRITKGALELADSRERITAVKLLIRPCFPKQNSSPSPPSQYTHFVASRRDHSEEFRRDVVEPMLNVD